MKKEYFRNINVISISNNKTFWKIVKLNFDKKNKTKKIILVENEEIISENIQTVEVFNNYFVTIVRDLNIPNISFTPTFENPVTLLLIP